MRRIYDLYSREGGGGLVGADPGLNFVVLHLVSLPAGSCEWSGSSNLMQRCPLCMCSVPPCGEWRLLPQSQSNVGSAPLGQNGTGSFGVGSCEQLLREKRSSHRFPKALIGLI